MSAQIMEADTTSAATPTKSVLKLIVNNHAGVMSHVCGLFSRRSYNLEGIMVMPIASEQGARSCIWLLLDEKEKLPQIIQQTQKLVDVLSIERHPLSGSVFEKTNDYFTA